MFRLYSICHLVYTQKILAVKVKQKFVIVRKSLLYLKESNRILSANIRAMNVMAKLKKFTKF